MLIDGNLLINSNYYLIFHIFIHSFITIEVHNNDNDNVGGDDGTQSKWQPTYTQHNTTPHTRSYT